MFLIKVLPVKKSCISTLLQPVYCTSCFEKPMIADYDSLVDTSGSEKSESESQISELHIILCTKLS